MKRYTPENYSSNHQHAEVLKRRESDKARNEWTRQRNSRVKREDAAEPSVLEETIASSECIYEIFIKLKELLLRDENSSAATWHEWFDTVETALASGTEEGKRIAREHIEELCYALRSKEKDEKDQRKKAPLTQALALIAALFAGKEAVVPQLAPVGAAHAQVRGVETRPAPSVQDYLNIPDDEDIKILDNLSGMVAFKNNERIRLKVKRAVERAVQRALQSDNMSTWALDDVLNRSLHFREFIPLPDLEQLLKPIIRAVAENRPLSLFETFDQLIGWMDRTFLIEQIILACKSQFMYSRNWKLLPSVLHSFSSTEQQTIARAVISNMSVEQTFMYIQYLENSADTQFLQAHFKQALEKAAEQHNYNIFFTNLNRAQDRSFVRTLLKTVVPQAVKNDPLVLLWFITNANFEWYTGKKFVKQYLPETIRNAIQTGRYTDVFDNLVVDKVQNSIGKDQLQELARPLVERGIESEPQLAIEYFDRIKDIFGESYAQRNVKRAIAIDPLAISRLVMNNDDTFNKMNAFLTVDDNIIIKTFLQMHKRKMEMLSDYQYSRGPKYNTGDVDHMMALLHQVVNNQLSIEDIVNMMDVIEFRKGYWRNSRNDIVHLGRDDSESFFQHFVKIWQDKNPIGYRSVETLLQDDSLRKVQKINELRNNADAVRFKSVEHSSFEELYILLVHGEEEVFTSTFNGLFNRLMERMRGKNLTGGQFLESAGYNKFRTFVKLCADFGRLKEFLGTMDASAQKVLLERFVSDIEGTGDMLAQAVSVADTFSMLTDPTILQVVQEKIKREYDRVSKEGNKEAIAVYGLLAGMFGGKAVINEQWLSDMAEKYKISSTTRLESEQLFNPDGSNIQQYFFYDDEDGKASFQNFLAQYKGKNGWHIETQETYVHITSEGSAKRVEIYANKPEHEGRGVDDIEKVLSERSVKTIVVVHRGHSYHVSRTIKRIPSIAKIVALGSCGGYKNISAVLEKTPAAHLITTKGVGTKLVNDPLLYLLNEEIKGGGDIDWPTFWNKARRFFGNNADFEAYVSPHHNLGVLFLKAYNNLLQQ